MARWKLLGPHYIKTDPSVQIEFKETDRNTGRQARKVFDVPRYLDPNDPGDCNRQGDCIVCDGNNPQPGDHIIPGPPGPDMEGLDDEAKKISKGYTDSGAWTKKEEGLDFGETLIKNFMAKMEQVQFTPISTAGIDPKAFANLQEQVKALMEQNVKLLAEKQTLRRV